jgi:hypothetical protein
MKYRVRCNSLSSSYEVIDVVEFAALGTLYEANLRLFSWA